MSSEAVIEAVLASDAFARRVSDIARPLARDALVGPQIAGLLEPGSVPQRAVRTPVVTALPRTPQEGDEVYYVADADGGVVWHLIYLKRVSALLPWLYVGGPPLTAAVETDQSTTSTTFVALAMAGPSITVPLAGDYIVTVSGNSYSSVGTGSNLHSYDIGATAASSAWGADQHANGTSQAQQYAAEDVQTGLAAATALVSKYANSAAATGQWRRRRMSVLPRRVG